MISVGIDVSKDEITVCIIRPGEEKLKPLFNTLRSTCLD